MEKTYKRMERKVYRLSEQNAIVLAKQFCEIRPHRKLVEAFTDELNKCKARFLPVEDGDSLHTNFLYRANGSTIELCNYRGITAAQWKKLKGWDKLELIR